MTAPHYRDDAGHPGRATARRTTLRDAAHVGDVAGNVIAHIPGAANPPKTIDGADAGAGINIPLTPSGRIAPDPTRDDERLPAAAAPDERPYRERPYIPRRHTGSTFDNFDPAWAGDAFTRELTAAANAAKRWAVAALEQRPAMLTIAGKPGNGKSHLLYAAAHYLAARRVPMFCYPWYLLADALRYGGALPWAPEKRVDGHVIRERLLRARVIILDEISATAGSEFDTNELRKVAGAAYDEGAAVLMTSNVWPLDTILGPAGADRFAALQLTAPSRRQEL